LNFNFTTASKNFLVIFLTTEPSTYYFGISCWLHFLLWLTAWSAANVRQRAAIDRYPSLQTLGTQVSKMTKLLKSREEPRNYPLQAKEILSVSANKCLDFRHCRFIQKTKSIWKKLILALV